jgi:hypothetical protein
MPVYLRITLAAEKHLANGLIILLHNAQLKIAGSTNSLERKEYMAVL